MTSKSGSIFAVSSNLIISAAGAGILSFPYAIERAGLIIGICLCVFFAYLNIFAMHILARHSGKNWKSSQPEQPQSFRDLVRMRLGKHAEYVAATSIYFGTLGALIGFLIIIADLTCPVLEQWFSKDSLIVQRHTVIIFFVVIVAIPLSAVEQLKSLAGSSFLAILSVLYVVFVVVFRYLSSTPLAPMRSIGPPSWWSIFEAMPIMLFAFGCPLQVVTSTFELRTLEDKAAHRVMQVSIFNTIGVCAAMYISVGM